METRRIAGLEIALVTKTEEAQRNLDAATRKFEALRKEVAAAGAPTRKQADELERLEFNLRKAATASAALEAAEKREAMAARASAAAHAFSDSAMDRNTAGLRRFKAIVEPTATSISGMASALGGVGSVAGPVVGALSNLTSAVGGAGGLGLALAAGGLAAGALGTALYELHQEAKELDQTMPRVAKGIEAAWKTTSDSIDERIKTLQQSIANFGKKAQEVQRDAAFAAQAQAMLGKDTLTDDVSRRQKIVAALRDEVALRERAGLSNDKLEEELSTQEQILSIQQKRLTVLDGDIERYQQEYDLAQQSLDQIEEAERREKARRAEKKRADEEGRAADQSALDAIKAIQDQWAKTAKNIEEANRQRDEFGRLSGQLAVDYGEAPIGDAPPIPDFDPRLGDLGSASEFGGEGAPPSMAGLTAAQMKSGQNIALAFAQGLSTGGPASALRGGLVAVAGEVAGPVAGGVVNAIAGTMERAAQSFADMLRTVFEEGTKNLATLVSGSSEASGVFGAMRGAAGSGMAIGGAIAGYGLTTSIMAGPFAPLAAIGSVGLGAAAGGAAAPAAFAVQMATMTDEFKETSGAFSIAMIPAIEAMEPFAERARFLAPLLGKMAEGLAETTAVLMDNGGMEFLFQTTKLGATAVLRLAQGATLGAMAMQELNMATAALVFGYASAVEFLDDMVGGAISAAMVAAGGSDADKALADSQVRMMESWESGHELGAAMESINAAITNLTGMTSDGAYAEGDKMAQEWARGQEALEGFNDELTRGTRNLPSFFKLGAARANAQNQDGGAPVLPMQQMTVIVVDDSSGTPEQRAARGLKRAQDELRRVNGTGSVQPVGRQLNQWTR